MKRMLPIVFYLFMNLILCFHLNAQHQDPRWDKWYAGMVEDSTFVEGFGVLEYFLYRVDANAGETDIMNPANFPDALIIEIEELGYIVDFNSIGVVRGNTDLSVNVRRLMSRHGANVSVTFLGPNSDNSVTVIINIDTSSITGAATYDFVSFNIYGK